MKRIFPNSRRPSLALSFALISSLAFWLTCSAVLSCHSQETAPAEKQTPTIPQTKTEEAQSSTTPQLPKDSKPLSPETAAGKTVTPAPPPQIDSTTDKKADIGKEIRNDPRFINFKSDGGEILPGGQMRFEKVEAQFLNSTVVADHMSGNKNEFVFSGNVRFDSQGTIALADVLHYYPEKNAYRLDNPRGILTPELLRNRVVDPIYVWATSIAGTVDGYASVDHCLATACKERFHHYEFRIKSADYYPLDKLVLRQVAVYFFGQKIITLPTLTIPLGLRFTRPRNPRTDYLPEIGQNSIEGYYARFPYSFTEGKDAATYVRADVTQKRGFGVRVEQEYLAGKQDNVFNTNSRTNQGGGFTGATSGTIATAYGYGNTGRLPALGNGLGPQSGGLFTLQGYLSDGFSRDFNTSFRHQQGIGSGNRFAFSTELRKNSELLGSNQTNTNTRFNFNHSDTVHNSVADFSLSLGTNSSDYLTGKFTSSQFAASYHHSFQFDEGGSTRNSLSYSFDLNRNLTETTSSGASTANRSAHLDSQFQFDHTAREYALSLQANKETAIGVQTGGGSFGSLEKLPELRFTSDTYNFKGGFLHQIPLRLEIGAGRFSEPSHSFQDDRLTLGLQLNEVSVARGRTEINTSGGFEQRLYGDGAAQYIVRNMTRLRQHLGGRSGFDLRYDYSQPEGGTPFQFDTLGRSHSITAEAGYLDDKRFQATVRTGYDFLGTSSANPYQSLSSRLMWRPTPSVRFDLLSVYNPNTGKFFSFTNRIGIRTHSDFAIDIVSRIDPSQPGLRRKFSQINTQFETPLGRTWNLTGLLRYNGATGKFESTNLQVSHQWDCLEASVSYSQNPLSFRSNQELFFTLRIKALPFSRGFARGSSGESLGVGLGSFN